MSSLRKRHKTRARPLNPCPPGKERNPATNRCRKIQTQAKPKPKPKPKTQAKPKPKTQAKPKPKTQAKPCPPGKERNPATNRCRKVPVSVPVSVPVPGKVKVVEDVLHNLVTINGHGTFNPKKIKVPKGFQVLVPHRKGLDIKYTTPDAGKNTLYEERLYGEGHLNYRKGWKLYLPGDDINDLFVSMFHDGAKCAQIDMHHELQKPLIKACRTGKAKEYQKSCPLYCTRPQGGTFDYLDYRGFHKLKMKACGRYSLSQLFKTLPKQLRAIPANLRAQISPGPTEPIVLVPFTCNADSGSPMNAFDLEDHTPLNEIYHTLIQERL